MRPSAGDLITNCKKNQQQQLLIRRRSTSSALAAQKASLAAAPPSPSESVGGLWVTMEGIRNMSYVVAVLNSKINDQRSKSKDHAMALLSIFVKKITHRTLVDAFFCIENNRYALADKQSLPPLKASSSSSSVTANTMNGSQHQSLPGTTTFFRKARATIGGSSFRLRTEDSPSSSSIVAKENLHTQPSLILKK